MKLAHVVFTGDFTVITGNARSQAALMVIAEGKTEGGAGNRHKGSDQWLFVASGSGTATIAGKSHKLHPGILVLIEKGETHEITNDGAEPLRTLNFYVPPAYSDDGLPLPPGQS